MLKKLLIGFLASLILFTSTLSFFAKSVQAQRLGGTWYSPDFGEFSNLVFDPDNPDEVFGERYTYAQVVWIFHSLIAILVPDIILSCFALSGGQAAPEDVAPCLGEIIEALTTNVEVSSSSDQNSNLAERINDLTSENSLSGVGYIKNSISKFKIIPVVSAQGFGYSNLAPMQSMWLIIRNISYLLLIIAFIIMAFMVMFRVKLSPQTVITVQSAIPRLIIVLILITFSYAIAGLIVDLSFVILGLVALLANSAGVSSLPVLELFVRLASPWPIAVMLMVSFFAVVGGIVLMGAAFFGAITGVGLVVIPFVILLLILLALLVIMTMRILWLMIRTFINIILLITIAPLFILIGIFPNVGGFGTWLRNLISQIAVFPVIALMNFFANFVFWGSVTSGNVPLTLILNLLNSLYPLANPYGIVAGTGTGTGAIALPGFYLGSSLVFGVVVSLGILLLIPSVGKIVQSAIAGKPFAIGTAIGEVTGPVAAFGMGRARQGAGVTGDYITRTYTRASDWRRRAGESLQRFSKGR